MRSITKGAVVAIAGSAAALLGAATPAFAGTITAPTPDTPTSSPTSYMIPVDASFNALPFTISGSGFTAGSSILPEICDGTPSTVSGWDPSTHCDLSTSPSPEPASSSGTVTFSSTDPNQQISDFNGGSPNGQFNCLAPGDVPSDAKQGPFPGEWFLTANDTTSPVEGVPLNSSTPAWTNCQLRLSSSDSFVTSDQAFLTLTIPTTAPYPNVPEAPFAIILPIGAAGLLAGGVVINRRRRRSARVTA